MIYLARVPWAFRLKLNISSISPPDITSNTQTFGLFRNKYSSKISAPRTTQLSPPNDTQTPDFYISSPSTLTFMLKFCVKIWRRLQSYASYIILLSFKRSIFDRRHLIKVFSRRGTTYFLTMSWKVVQGIDWLIW